MKSYPLGLLGNPQWATLVFEWCWRRCQQPKKAKGRGAGRAKIDKIKGRQCWCRGRRRCSRRQRTWGCCSSSSASCGWVGGGWVGFCSAGGGRGSDSNPQGSIIVKVSDSASVCVWAKAVKRNEKAWKIIILRSYSHNATHLPPLLSSPPPLNP